MALRSLGGASIYSNLDEVSRINVGSEGVTQGYFTVQTLPGSTLVWESDCCT